jgi:hypothetical protein
VSANALADSDHGPRNAQFSLPTARHQWVKVTTKKCRMSKLTKFQLTKYLEITDKLTSWSTCTPFVEMFDSVRDGARDWFECIREPMALTANESDNVHWLSCLVYSRVLRTKT